MIYMYITNVYVNYPIGSILQYSYVSISHNSKKISIVSDISNYYYMNVSICILPMGTHYNCIYKSLSYLGVRYIDSLIYRDLKVLYNYIYIINMFQ